MFWHIDDDIICLIFMVALLVAMRKDFRRDSKRDRSFMGCLVVSIFLLVVDIAASLAMDLNFQRDLYNTLMTLYFGTLLLGVCTWGRYTATLVYVNEPKKERVAHVIVIACYAVNVVLAVLNLKTGWLYTLGPNNEYSRGSLFTINYVLYVIYAFGLSSFIIIKWKKIESFYIRWLLLMLPALLGIGIYVQLTMPGWLTIVPSLCAALFISYLFIENDRIKTLLGMKQEEIRCASEAASIDAMTRLLNHTETFKRIDEYIKNCGSNSSYAMLMIDIDDFKQINDVLGHQAGDDALIRAAGKIKRCFRESDIVGRVGGDEFLVFMKNTELSGIPERKAAELLELLQFSCSAAGKTVGLTASIGIGVHSGAANGIDKLYADADAALYKAKETGKNRYAIANGLEDVKVYDVPSGTVHLRTLLENMDGGIVLASVGKDIDITYVSPSYYRSLVMDYDELDEEKLDCDPGAIVYQIHPEDRSNVFSECRKAANTGEVTECTYRVGKYGDRWHLIRIARLPAEAEGSCIPIICVITNITELKKSEMMLGAIIKDCPAGIGIYEVGDGMKLKPVYVNEKAININDIKSTEHEGEAYFNAANAVHPDDLSELMKKAAQLQTGKSLEIVYRNNPNICNNEHTIRARCTMVGAKDRQPLLLVISTSADERK